MSCQACSPRLGPLDLTAHGPRQDAIYLLLHGDLTAWEREFCKDMAKVWEPSEGQLHWLQTVCDKYLFRYVSRPGQACPICYSVVSEGKR